MLFIFRKLRRSFFPLRQGSEGHVLPGKVRTYLAYAVGEIALIMIGILLALQVSDWNQARKDRAEETEILVRLKADLGATRTSLTRYNQGIAQRRDIALLLLSFIEDTSSTPSEKELYRLLTIALSAPDFTSIISTYEEILASGNLRLIRSDSLRKKFAQIAGIVNDLEKTGNVLYNRWETVEEPYMIEHLDLSEVVKNQWYAEEIEIPSLPFNADPEAFRSHEFANILSGRISWLLDIRGYSKRLFDQIDQSLTLIDAELAERGVAGEQ